jgi:hypothetical protein
MIIAEYFWFFCGLWWLFIVFVFMRRNLQKLLDSNKLTKLEMRTFQIRIVYFTVVPCFLLQLIQLFGGYKYFYELPHAGLSNFWSILAWLVSIGYTFIFLYVIWFKKGDEYLAGFSHVLKLPQNPKSIKWLITFGLIVALTSGILQML